MSTLTIPKKITKGAELIIVPREEYDEFSRWRKAYEQPRKFKTFRPTAAELKDLKRARESYKKGKYITINELKRRLDIKS